MHEEHGGHAVHVPQPSWAPVILGTGVFFINLAFLFGIPFGVFGLLVFLSGVAQWVREDMRKYREQSDAEAVHE